jgi:hypothetical protein
MDEMKQPAPYETAPSGLGSFSFLTGGQHPFLVHRLREVRRDEGDTEIETVRPLLPHSESDLMS